MDGLSRRPKRAPNSGVTLGFRESRGRQGGPGLSGGMLLNLQAETGSKEAKKAQKEQ